MRQIIYASTAAKPMQPDDLADLLEKARAKNERLGVTGLLLYRDRAFLQVFEGEEDAVGQLYTTIKGDDRHFGLTTIADKTIEERDFPNWQMGFEDLGEADAEELPPGFVQVLQPDFDPEKLEVEPGAARNALLSFREATL